MCMSRNKKETIFFFYYVKEYIENMQIELKSQKTIETYRTGLNDFRKYFFTEHGKSVDRIMVSDISADMVNEYLYWLVKNGCSINTRNIRLAAIKSYLNYASFRNIDFVTAKLSISKIKSKKVQPKTHNWLNKPQIETLLEQPSKTRMGIRDRFIMIFMYSTGARLNELLGVRLKDIVCAGEYPYVYLHGKGNKTRIVPVPEGGFTDNLNYYLSLYHTNRNPDCYLFYTVIKDRKDAMSEDNIQRIIKKYGVLAQVKDETFPSIHPHLLRHSYGAQLYRLGATLPEIAKLMGHSDIKTTEIYAETDMDMVSKAVSNTIEKQPVRVWDSLSEHEKLKVLGFKK